MLYDCQSDKVIVLHAKNVHASKLMRGTDNIPTSITLPAVTVNFRVSISQVPRKTVRPDYDRYGGMADKPDGAGGPETDEGVDLYALFEKNLLWRLAEDAHNVTEEVLYVTGSLVMSLVHDMPV